MAERSPKRTDSAASLEKEDTSNIVEEFLEVLVSSCDISKIRETELSKKISKKARAVEARMDKLYHEVINSRNTRFNDVVALAQSYLYMSYIHTKDENKKERLYVGADHLLRSLELLQENIFDCRAILIVLRALHEFARIYNTLEDLEKTEQFLYKAYQIYLVYTKQKNYPTPINIINVVNIDGIKDTKFRLNNLYEVTLAALINLYSVKSRYINKDKAMMYKHQLLKNQLNYIATFDEIDYIEWIAGSAVLSECLVKSHRFTDARNHLAAASFVLNKYSEVVINTNREIYPDLYIMRDDHYQYGKALVSEYWATYGLELLRLLYVGLVQNKEDEHCKTCALPTEFLTDSKEQYTKLTFPNLEGDLKEYMTVITDKYLSNYEDAQVVGLNVLEWLEEAKTYNTADRYKLNYAEIVRNVSKVYKYLGHFEMDKQKHLEKFDCQLKLLKTALKSLNLDEYPAICNQIFVEFVTIYSTLFKISTDTITAFETIKEDTIMQMDTTDFCKRFLECFKSYFICCDINGYN